MSLSFEMRSKFGTSLKRKNYPYNLYGICNNYPYKLYDITYRICANFDNWKTNVATRDAEANLKNRNIEKKL